MEDSLPKNLLLRWKNELNLKRAVENVGAKNIFYVEQDYFEKIEAHLDTNAGRCWLKNPAIACMVTKALRYGDGKNYFLQAWTIMPNHVHLLFNLVDESKLSSVVQGWKSFTAHEANRLLQRSGRFWQPEYYDRLVRSTRQFEFSIRYIINNPVKAGLCKDPFQWAMDGVFG